MTTAIIIPARAGSKRLPGKNMHTVAGKPLIYWCAKAATDSDADQVVVSTDSVVVADYILQEFDGEIGVIMRPARLATDDSPVLHTIHHAMWIIKKADYLQLVQPTSPLITKDHIDDVIEKIHHTPCGRIMSGCPKCKISDGMIYIAKWDLWKMDWWNRRSKDIRILEPWLHVDINTEKDMEVAEIELRQRLERRGE